MRYSLSDAQFSGCGTWRYVLVRRWGCLYDTWSSAGYKAQRESTVNFICLNPSTATGSEDDPTVRRLVGFAMQWGYSGLVLTNIFALRATDPKELRRATDPIGPENDTHILEQAKASSFVVCAWGNWGRLTNRGMAVQAMLCREHVPIRCFGLTKAYRTKSEPPQPKHPLYLPANCGTIQFCGATIAGKEKTDDRQIPS